MGARRYEVTRRIAAPPATVWGLLIDADAYRNWNRAVIDIRGPIRIGERIRLVSVADPKRTFRVKVSEMDEPTRMVWSDGIALGLPTS